MIDLHAHVLPGLDDGPATLVSALNMLRVMSRQGITTVVAGCHGLDGRYNATRDAVLSAAEVVNAALEAEGTALEVIPGMELYLGFDTLRALKSGKVMGMGDTPILVVELPPREFPLYAERALFELMIAGYRPILNHPERNRGIQKSPDTMRRLAEHGVGAMVTAASLLGRFGAEAQALAEAYIQEGVADLVVSDAHDLAGRSPLLPDGLVLARDLGKADQSAEQEILSFISRR